MAKRVQNLRNKKISEVPADDLQQKKKRRASLEIPITENNLVTSDDIITEKVTRDVTDKVTTREVTENKLSVSDTPSIEVKEAKVFNLPSPTSTEEKELKQFEELEKSILKNQNETSSNDKTSRDSGVSDGSTPDQEPSSTRNPCDPLPQAPVKAELVTNELEEEEILLDPTEDSRKPPPYHIAAQMSRHANDFQILERKSSFMSDVTMESISGKYDFQTRNKLKLNRCQNSEARWAEVRIK